jgi:hypothetical protein
MELYPLVQREGIRQAIWRDGPGCGQIPNNLRIVMRVKHDQGIVHGG